MEDTESKKNKIDSVRGQIEWCNSCSLCAGRIVPVVDDGNVDAKILIAAEA